MNISVESLLDDTTDEISCDLMGEAIEGLKNLVSSEEIITPKEFRSNGKFEPKKNGLKVVCNRCREEMSFKKKDDGGIEFPPALICSNRRCKKNKK